MFSPGLIFSSLEAMFDMVLPFYALNIILSFFFVLCKSINLSLISKTWRIVLSGGNLSLQTIIEWNSVPVPAY